MASLLHPDAFSTFQQLKDAKLFSTVGIKDSDYPVYVDSWEAAVVASGSEVWADLRLQATNSLALKVDQTNRVAFREWNNVLNEVNLIVDRFVSETLAHNTSVHGQIASSFKRDCRLILLESHYSHIVGRGFFLGLGYWYLAGHFPCGWSGEHPAGRLVVF